ncbi:MAG: hypothetical protein H7A50_06680 [Akkermansiaceae bacterium]|nr:hypothetical protein [Akkermansiaceae bacterium]
MEGRTADLRANAGLGEETVPAFGGDIWAPDILHMMASLPLTRFPPSPQPAIGYYQLRLDSGNPGSEWKDHGVVVRSIARTRSVERHDPNVTIDSDGTPWMARFVFGRA